MRHRVRGAFWISVAVLLVAASSFIGPAVASPSADPESQDFAASCTYDTENFQVGTVPAEFSSPKALVNNTQYTGSTYLAKGDWLALRLPTSNNSTCSSTELPGSNLAYAKSATPGANTEHTIAPFIDEPISGVQQIAIEYELRPAVNGGLHTSNVSVLGVDKNSDGIVDKSLKSHLEYLTLPDSDTVQFALDGNVSLPADSYLIARYGNIRNPNYTDVSGIRTTIVGNQTETETGRIAYDKGKSGLIGQNVTLSISPVQRSTSQVMTLRPFKIRFSQDSLYLFMPTSTSSLAQSPRYSLTVTKGQDSNGMMASTYTPNSRMVTLFDRYAYIFSNPKFYNGTVTVWGYTNLAPGSQIGVRVYNDLTLTETITTVEGSQFWSAKIDLGPKLASSDPVTISVVDAQQRELDNTTVSPP